MAVALGQSAYVQIGDESTYGTIAAAFRGLEVSEENIKGETSYLPKSALRTVSRFHRVKSKIGVGGNFVMQGNYNALEKILKHTFGSVVDSGAGPYTHTYSCADALPTGLSLIVNRDSSAVTEEWNYLGCQIKKLTLSQKVEDFLMVDVEVVGRDFSTAPTIAVSFPAFAGIDWTQLTVQVGGSPVAVSEFEVVIENTLAEDRYKLGDRLRKGLGRAGTRNVSGKMTFELESLTQWDLWKDLTASDINAAWTDGTNSLTLDMNKVYFKGSDPSASDAGPISLELEFDAFYNSAANDEITAVLINQIATA